MPRRNDIKSVLVIGAGPIVIGQACEFDYSGTQACKALVADGYKVILVNSNPATIMTDPNFSHRTYMEPIEAETVEQIIAYERPDAILPTTGGQAALNCALELDRRGVLKKYNVELLGANAETIIKAENREVFRELVDKLGLRNPNSMIAHNMKDAINALDHLRMPLIVRPSFTLGGSGGGIVYNKEEFHSVIAEAFSLGSVLQIDEFLMGWKEFELEVVRDAQDNCIVVCAIENLDPMGVHTGDSVTVAPILTLTDKEYQKMRDDAFAIMREVGVTAGGANVQFAMHPGTGEIVVIEMNPRVSRSSALASKATGFPIAKVSAKLAVGYSLNEIMNDCAGSIPASFEPAMDYIVVKAPKFNFDKFNTKQELSSSMKAVGEVMAVGRSFEEALQKAMVSMEESLTGLNTVCGDIFRDVKAFDNIEKPYLMSEEDRKTCLDYVSGELGKFRPDRIRLIADAFRLGMTVKEVSGITHYDPWFLERIFNIVTLEQEIVMNGVLSDKLYMMRLKQYGFSDERIAELYNMSKAKSSGDDWDWMHVRQMRKDMDVVPVFKNIDTCAGEFVASANYLYSTYEHKFLPEGHCDLKVLDGKKAVVLGSGPNRIGQGVEFDYACVHAASALRDMDYEVIMVNSNPETVSTDYDSSSKLYFEPLTPEKVLDILDAECRAGVLSGVAVQFGGQTPLGLGKVLEKFGMPIMGSAYEAIDLAEDRERFRDLLRSLNMKQSDSVICYSIQEIKAAVANLSYPVLVRPSYVLGGKAMLIIRSDAELDAYLEKFKIEKFNGSILVDSFLENAIEVDVDAVSDGSDVFVAGVMEHIEEAGVHSGDSCCCLPPYSLTQDVVDEIIKQTIRLGIALKVVGLFNAQYAIKDGDIYVIEVNPRSSRTTPFVAKATGIPIASIAASVIAGKKLKEFDLRDTYTSKGVFAVKRPVFPFLKFSNVDVLLSPEMKSTGEVIGIDDSFGAACIKAYKASGEPLSKSGNVLISVKDDDKESVVEIAKDFVSLGFKVLATSGTCAFLRSKGVAVERAKKVSEGRPHIVDMILNSEIQYVVNTTKGKRAIVDNLSIRRTLLLKKIPYTTTIRGARAAIVAFKDLLDGKCHIKALQDLHDC